MKSEVPPAQSGELASVPTIGMEEEIVEVGDKIYTFVDFAGQSRFRTYWKSFDFFAQLVSITTQLILDTKVKLILLSSLLMQAIQVA